MTNDEIAGRLAALEVIARITLWRALSEWFGGSHPQRIDGLLATLTEKINSGEEAASPTSASARAEMIETLERVFRGTVEAQLQKMP